MSSVFNHMLVCNSDLSSLPGNICGHPYTRRSPSRLWLYWFWATHSTFLSQGGDSEVYLYLLPAGWLWMPSHTGNRPLSDVWWTWNFSHNRPTEPLPLAKTYVYRCRQQLCPLDLYIPFWDMIEYIPQAARNIPRGPKQISKVSSYFSTLLNKRTNSKSIRRFSETNISSWEAALASSLLSILSKPFLMSILSHLPH